MNKKDYTGWKDVFYFAFTQGVKSKAYKVSLVIFAVLFILGTPIVGFINSRDTEKVGDTKVDTLTICDSTGFDFNYDEILKDSRYSSLKIVKEDASRFDSLKEDMKNDKKSCNVLARITYDPAGLFSLTFVKPSSAGFDSDDFNKLTADFEKEFDNAKITAIDVTPEQIEYVRTPVSYGVEESIIDENGTVSIEKIKENEGISLAEYTILLGGLIFIMLIINMSGGQIASQIVTEKSTRVVEYLMINVRPLALIIGKILSSLLLVLIEFLTMAVAFAMGNAISGMLFGSMNEVSDNSLVLFINSLSQVSPAKFVLCLIILMLGVLFFGILAALAGASVSKIEEMAEGMKTYQQLLMLGYFLGLAVCIMEMSGGVAESVVNALALIPISTPFIVPGNLILGKVSMTTGVIGALILAAVTVLLYVFTARVYEAMIFYNGKVLKIKDIVQLAAKRSNSKQEASKHE